MMSDMISLFFIAVWIQIITVSTGRFLYRLTQLYAPLDIQLGHSHRHPGHSHHLLHIRVDTVIPDLSLSRENSRIPIITITTLEPPNIRIRVNELICDPIAISVVIVFSTMSESTPSYQFGIHRGLRRRYRRSLPAKSRALQCLLFLDRHTRLVQIHAILIVVVVASTVGVDTVIKLIVGSRMTRHPHHCSRRRVME